ncbi:MAG TPA: cysteine desulfurase NifS, partial [Candidatus Paceibacterota bacterium]
MFGKRRVYMDYAAATPVHPEVARAVAAATKEFFGNPSAPHLEGRLARSAIDEARGKIAQSFSV